MRPLIVDLGREYRGGQHQALLLLRGLRARGQDPEVLTVRGSQLAQSAKETGIRVCAVAGACRRFAAALEIRRRASGAQIDLLHANEPHGLTASWLAHAHRFVPVVASRRVPLPLARSPISLARYRSAARVVAVSHCVENHVLACGLPSSRIEVIYDGVEIPAEISCAERETARRDFGLPEKSPCVGYVAALVPRKGHARLVRAFAALRLQFPGCMLLLWGEGPERQDLEKLAHELQIFHAVKLVGTGPRVEAVFAAIDVFAFPSCMEALGTALLAAMARALPVVSAARDGMLEVVEDGKNGLLMNDLEPRAFSAAIARLLSQPEHAKQLGRAAREAVVLRFSADRMVDETLRLYQRLVTSGR